MEQQQFEALIRKLATEPSRRRTVLRLVAAALSGLLTHAGLGTPTAAAAGCLKVDKPCRRASQCCSGICKGKKGKKKCRGHGAGTCRPGQGVCTAQVPEVLTCNNRPDCFCFQTTAGTSFCKDATVGGCAVCQRDADCVTLGFPPGSACLPITSRRCAGTCESGRFCAGPCGFEPLPTAADGDTGRGPAPGPLGGDR